MGGTQDDSRSNAEFLFAGTTEVNYELPATTQLVLSASSFMGGSREACSSIKRPDMLMLKWLRRPDVAQQRRFCYHPFGNLFHLAVNPSPLPKKYEIYAYFEKTVRHNASKKTATERTRLIRMLKSF